MPRTQVQVWRHPSRLDAVRVAPDFVAIARSDRVPAAMRACLANGAVVIAALVDGVLSGYATIVPSSALAGERWQDLPDVLELGAVEVARSGRRRGIATAVLGELGGALPLQRLVLMTRGLCHHWDWGDAELSPRGYRRMLVELLGRAGFVEQGTDDPEVRDNPLNFLAVRFGERAPGAALRAFHERTMLGAA